VADIVTTVFTSVTRSLLTSDRNKTLLYRKIFLLYGRDGYDNVKLSALFKADVEGKPVCSGFTLVNLPEREAVRSTEGNAEAGDRKKTDENATVSILVVSDNEEGATLCVHCTSLSAPQIASHRLS
jgi:hypothetical protein